MNDLVGRETFSREIGAFPVVLFGFNLTWDSLRLMEDELA